MKKKIIIVSVVAVALAVGGVFFFTRSKADNDGALPHVKVTRGKIIDKALAVGTIEPQNEISIKSKVGGVVRHIFVEMGTYVKAGTPLLEVKPDPAPSELANAKRQVELADVELRTLNKQRLRQDTMLHKQLISQSDYDETMRQYDEAVLHVKMEKENLALLVSGSVLIDSTEIQSIVYAPIDGFLLNKTVEVGDPVTPLTTYQEGTVLMKMANMEDRK